MPFPYLCLTYSALTLAASHSTFIILIIYCSDNVPTFLVKSWSLDADLFDGDLVAGPVPSLFGDDEEAITTAIDDNLARFHADLLKLYKLFLMPESVSISKAQSLMKKMRYFQSLCYLSLPESSLSILSVYGYI